MAAAAAHTKATPAWTAWTPWSRWRACTWRATGSSPTPDRQLGGPSGEGTVAKVEAEEEEDDDDDDDK